MNETAPCTIRPRKALEREPFWRSNKSVCHACQKEGITVGFAIYFYKKIGAIAMDEWTVYRLDDSALVHAAKGMRN